MLDSLPSNLFCSILVFTSPKEVFASKRVSRRFLRESKRPSVWKRLLQSKYPDIPIYGDYEDVVRQLEKPIQPRHPSLEKFEFILTVFVANKRIFTERWQKGVRPFNNQINPDTASKFWKELDASDCEDDGIYCDLTVILHTPTKQYRRVRIHLVDGDVNHLNFIEGLERDESTIDVQIKREEEKTTYSLSVWSEF